MKARDSYDLIAIGDHAGSLLSAVMAARAGFSVLIIPQSLGITALTVNVPQGEQVFDPEVNALGGVHTHERYRAPIEEILKRSGILDGEWDAVQITKRGIELVTDMARLRLGGGFRDIVHELKREFGGDTKEWYPISSSLKKVEEACLGHWGRSAHRLGARRHIVETKSESEVTYKSWSRTLKRAVIAAAREYSSTWTTQPFHSILDAFEDSAFGAETYAERLQMVSLMGMEAPFRGGMTAWRSQLLRLAKRLGAEVAPKADCKHIWVARGRFSGVQLSSKGGVIEGRSAVLGIPLSMARERILHSGVGNWRSLKSPLEPSGWRFTIALTVHQESIPQGLSSRLVIAEGKAPALEIEIASPEDYGVNDPEYCTLFLRTVFPFDLESLRPEYQRMMAARMVRKLTELFPYVEYHVVHLYPDFRISTGQRRKLGIVSSGVSDSELSESTFEVYGEFTQLEQIPHTLRVYSGRGHGSQSGIGHMFLVGQEAYPELGAWGSSWAAVEATQWLAQKSGMSSILQGERKEEKND